MSDPADPPGVLRRDVVLVTGPPHAGVTSLVQTLRQRLPGHGYVEDHEIGVGTAPVAVLFVVSAVAPVTESDCALADLASTQTDVVIAAVTKIDDHRDWRAVLAADREKLGARVPRLRGIPWTGVAAAPRLGEPFVDGLVETLQRHLGHPRLTSRNSLRAWESRLCAEIEQQDALRRRRDELVRQRNRSRAEGVVALRGRIQQTRVALLRTARHRCLAARTELLGLAATTGRGSAGFVRSVRRRCGDVAGEVDEEIIARTRALASELGLTEPPRSAAGAVAPIAEPLVRTRRLETQLMTVLGAGFGLGVALVLSRLFSGLAPGFTGAAASTGVGLAVTVWVVRVRTLLHDRAVLDRWVDDAITTLRQVLEERVVLAVLAVESALVSQHLARHDTENSAVAARVAEIDAELREHRRAAAPTRTVPDGATPSSRQQLEAVRTALATAKSTETLVTGR
ncbi:Uncharacterised protein [Mycolicibacterium vanbaalenii]|uniref:Uncharacterized protein n=1 Tax=Mycolicibacterium vanbaalenii TaxID=110539 RepID=A0A5S9QZ29_MYCVN|nr:hypothetical protein [Mycolicibacterium vanbaalenii]CAA0124827.1 Uncharacterised protein [Mycolicibacterium vanbaalenii]